MTSRTAVALVVLVTIPACRSRPHESRAPSQDTAFGGTMAPVQRIRSKSPGVAPHVLRAVETRTAPRPSPGYDRVVFEFTGDSVPGYRVEYTKSTVQRCGSGDPVTVAGTGRLIVRFQPAQAHDELGNLAPAEADAVQVRP